MRTAVGRCALRLAFLVGAVLVLGVLCAEQAQAADDGGPVNTSSASPVADRPGGVVDGLAGVPEKVLPVPSLPSRPQVPAPPALPGLTQPAPLPELPGLPEIPVEPRLPGLPAVLPDAPDAPDALPVPPTQPEAPEPPASEASAPTTRPEATEAATHGPGVGGARAGLAVAPLPHDGTERRATTPPATTPPAAPHTDPASAPHAPGGSPEGTTGNRSAADHGAPCHGDAHAVTPDHRLHVRLVPGAIASAEAAGTRGRYRDVPVSPA